METNSLKALSHAVLQRNWAGNKKETESFHDGNLGGVNNSKSFQSETQGNFDPDDIESLFSILKMTLSEYKQGGYLVRIKSKVLGEDVYIASTEKEAAIGRAEGLVTYMADEIIQLVRSKSTPEELQSIHKIKQTLGGTLTGVTERNDKPVRKKGVSHGR